MVNAVVVYPESTSQQLEPQSNHTQVLDDNPLIGGQSPQSLTPSTVTKSLAKLINEFETLFAQSPTDVGKINVESHRIHLTDDVPVALRPYRQSSQAIAETARQVKELLNAGLIRVSVSPYAAPTTLADKADCTKRLCCDYRGLNGKTIADKQPMPYIPDVIDKLQGCRFFTKLDMASGYWQVPIHPEDIHKTAFVTQNGHYEWLVLPFGLNNAPATFHRIVQRILGNLLNHGVYSYLDDVILYAKTQEEHDTLLREVFTRLKDHNVKLKRTKCMFSQPNVEFLGHIINNDQVRPIPSKVKSVLDFPDPKNVKELQQFLGLTGYFREYIPEYSTIAEPLPRLLRKCIGFEWGSAQQQAAQTLKQSLANDPVRVIFNPDSYRVAH